MATVPAASSLTINVNAPLSGLPATTVLQGAGNEGTVMRTGTIGSRIPRAANLPSTVLNLRPVLPNALTPPPHELNRRSLWRDSREREERVAPAIPVSATFFHSSTTDAHRQRAEELAKLKEECEEIRALAVPSQKELLDGARSEALRSPIGKKGRSARVPPNNLAPLSIAPGSSHSLGSPESSNSLSSPVSLGSVTMHIPGSPVISRSLTPISFPSRPRMVDDRPVTAGASAMSSGSIPEELTRVLLGMAPTSPTARLQARDVVAVQVVLGPKPVFPNAATISY